MISHLTYPFTNANSNVSLLIFQSPISGTKIQSLPVVAGGESLQLVLLVGNIQLSRLVETKSLSCQARYFL